MERKKMPVVVCSLMLAVRGLAQPPRLIVRGDWGMRIRAMKPSSTFIAVVSYNNI
ncbi:hypothetical protein ACFPMF_04245 [Larkinella bovis]|uniref:Uncharacterized protein n=1 Tax=Larkinella bovis TaxID=683041 RepID=A0ABW0I796_9BACT